MSKTFFFLLALVGILYGTTSDAFEAPTISLSDIAEGKVEGPVAVRGFLYKDEAMAGRWILLDKPNIRSCCVHKEKARVEVYGGIPSDVSMGSALLVQGILHRESGGIYTLTEASIVQETHDLTFLFAFAFAAAVAVGIFLLKKRA